MHQKQGAASQQAAGRHLERLLGEQPHALGPHALLQLIETADLRGRLDNVA